MIADEHEIDSTEQAFVSALIARSPELAQTITVARAFWAMVRGQRAGELDNWLWTADGTPLRGFANGLKRDLAAVRAALCPAVEHRAGGGADQQAQDDQAHDERSRRLRSAASSRA